MRMKEQVQGMGRTLQIGVNMHARRGVREVILFNRVRESLSQKLIVPSAPAVVHVQKRLEKVWGGGGKSYRRWRMYRVLDGS